MGVIGIVCEVNQFHYIFGDSKTDPDDHDHEGGPKAKHEYCHCATFSGCVFAGKAKQRPDADQHRAFGRFRDGPQAKHVPRGQRGLGRGSIAVSLVPPSSYRAHTCMPLGNSLVALSEQRPDPFRSRAFYDQNSLRIPMAFMARAQRVRCDHVPMASSEVSTV